MKENRTIGLLFILLLLSIVFLVLLAMASQHLGSKAVYTNAPVKPTQAPARAFTDLSATTEKSEVTVGETFPITVSVDTGGNLVTIVQLELSYDPNLVTVASLSPGNFFKNPIEYANKIDKAKGEIAYATGSFEGKKGLGTLVTINVAAKKKTQGASPVEVLTIKSTSIVAELGNEQSVLRMRKGASVVIR